MKLQGSCEGTRVSDSLSELAPDSGCKGPLWLLDDTWPSHPAQGNVKHHTDKASQARLKLERSGISPLELSLRTTSK